MNGRHGSVAARQFENDGTMDFMQIDTTRPISREHNQKRPELKFKSRQRVVPSRNAAPPSSQTDFSPLVQEFLDDCGYSNK